MKKIITISATIIFVLVIGLTIAASIFLTPIADKVIKEQLANYGYKNAEIGDISIGLHKTTLSNIQLNNKGKTTLGEISVSYWPLQLLEKRINTVKISNSDIDIKIAKNGDVFVADYLVYNLLTATPQIKKTYNYHQSNFSLIKKAHAASNSALGNLPLNYIELDNVTLALKTPSQKTVKTTINAELSTKENAVKGGVRLLDVAFANLYELGHIIKPELLASISDVSGALTSDINFSINNIDNLSSIKGDGVVTVKDLSLNHDGVKVKGINTAIEITNLLPFSTAQNQKVTIQNVKKSIVSMDNIVVDFGLKDTTKLNLNSSLLNLSGGTISTGAFNTDLTNINGTVNVTLKDVNLLEFSKLLGLGFLIKGDVNTTIPVKIKDNKVVLDSSTVNLLLQSVTNANLSDQATKLIDKVIDNGSDGAKAGKTIAKDAIKNLLGNF